MRVHMIMLERMGTIVEINRILVDGFKNISNVNLELNKITSLLSINSYGKSNLLEGINFGFDFILELPKLKEAMMSWENGFPLLKNSLNKNYIFEIEFSTKLNDNSVDVIYGYEFKWGNYKKNSHIVKENLKIKEIEASQKYTLYLDRDQNNALYKPSISGRCDKEILIDSNELLINKLKAYDNLYYLDIIKIINNFNVYIEKHFDSYDLYTFRPFIRKGESELSPFHDKRSIARVLYFLKKENKKQYDLIINTLQDLFPFIEKVQIKEINLTNVRIKSNITEEDPYELAENEYVLYAYHKNLVKPVSFSEMSDGVRRILLTLTYISLSEIYNIPLIAIEEPENSINPGLLRKYLIALDSFAEKAKIIITSHSPFLINYIDISNLYLGVPNSNGNAIFRKIKKSAVNKVLDSADEMDMLTGEYLFDLMSGSDDDIEYLAKYLENE